MKKMRRGPIVACLLTGLIWAGVLLPVRAQTVWTQKEFVLGTFWDPAADARIRDFRLDSARFAAARNAHFNLLTGTQDYYNIDRTPEGMRRILRVARTAGLNYLITDDRFFPVYEHPFDSTLAEKIFLDYRSLPDSLREVLYGYMLADEPQFRRGQITAVRQWKQFAERVEPTKLVYYNLVASYGASYNWGGFSGGDGDKRLSQRERRNYERYLQEYAVKLHPAVVSFDHYPFFRDGSIRPDYFYNLDVIARVAGDRPFWAYPMTVDHLDYIDPDEPRLRYMYFCPIAYGAKGLVVFTYQQPNIREYREAIVDKDGRPTKKYPIIRQLNDYVSRVLGPIVMRCRSVGVFHASAFPSQQWIEPMAAGDSFLIDSVLDDHLLVGVFEGDSGYYLFTVNKSLEPLHSAAIVLRGDAWKGTILPSVVGFGEDDSPVHTKLPVRSGDGKTTLDLPPLSGGEGRMIKIVRSN